MDMEKFLAERWAPGREIMVGIQSLAHGGDGVGRDGQMVVFVPGALPGDMVKAEITEYKRSFVRARIKQLIARSADRIEPPCPVAAECGGCQLQYLSYPAQVKAKHGVVQDQLRMVGGLKSAPVMPTVKCPEPFGYRIRARLGIEPRSEGYRIGYRGAGSHELVEFESCMVLHRALDDALGALKKALPAAGAGLRGEVEILCPPDGSEVLLRLLVDGEPWEGGVALAEGMRAAGTPLTGLVVDQGNRRETHGQDFLEIPVGRHRFRVSAGSFFQGNGLLLEKLVEQANLLLTPTERDVAVDLYAGVGLFTLLLAETAKETVAVESHPGASGDLKANLKQAGQTARVVVKQVEKAVFAPPLKETEPTALILDPPRSGAHKRVIQHLVAARLEKLLYVGCDPALMARDVRILVEGGYKLKAVQPLDLFPQTYHVECLVYLTHPYAKYAPDILFKGDF